MAMEFYVLDKTFKILGVIDTYKSAIWTERYYESGDFELYIPMNDDILSILKKHNYVVRMEDTTKCAVIESLKISQSADGGDYITASGRNVSSLLSRRIVWKQTTYSGKVEVVCRNIVRDAFVAPEMTSRLVDEFQLGTLKGFSETVKIQFTGDNVEEAIQNLCKTYKIGYKVWLDYSTKHFIFDLYKGVDRSYEQEENPYVVFSAEFENLLSSEYTSDDMSYKNVAQVAGEGQGTARKKVVVGSYSGLNRFETFVNASSVSTNDGEVNESSYNNLLRQQGLESLAELTTVESMDSEVAPNYSYKLGVDYNLGDIVEVANQYGIAISTRVTEIIESNDDTGYSCIPTFAVDEN